MSGSPRGLRLRCSVIGRGRGHGRGQMAHRLRLVVLQGPARRCDALQLIHRSRVEGSHLPDGRCGMRGSGKVGEFEDFVLIGVERAQGGRTAETRRRTRLVLAVVQEAGLQRQLIDRDARRRAREPIRARIGRDRLRRAALVGCVDAPLFGLLDEPVTGYVFDVLALSFDGQFALGHPRLAVVQPRLRRCAQSVALGRRWRRITRLFSKFIIIYFLLFY